MTSSLSGLGGMIVIDGMDGAGKGTQSKRLYAALKASGYEAILTREPGGSPGAEEIRRLVLEGSKDRWDAVSELLLMYTARRSHLVETVWPAIRAGAWVVCDRFADSSRSFQGIAGGLGLAAVEQVHSVAVGDFMPDLTIILDLDVAISLERAKQRSGASDRFESRGRAFYERVRTGFRSIAEANPTHYALIEGARSEIEVEAEIRSTIRERLQLRL